MANPLDKLGIDHLAGQSTPPTIDKMTETFIQCMESARGISVDYLTPESAMSFRFRYYKHRRKLQQAGNHSFDDIIIQIKGSELHFIPPVRDQIKRNL